MNRLVEFWGSAIGFLKVSRQRWWVDFILLAGFVGLIFGIFGVAHEWTMPKPGAGSPGAVVAPPDINLSVSSLPYYTSLTLARGMVGYILSILFTLLYGYWAAKDHVAERILVPMLDILQSIPILGFMPAVIGAMVALFPSSNLGLELAAVITIFTGQVWNMTFSYYHSLRSIPENLQEAATLYRFTWWERLKWLELPISMIGLVWNSMMSMAGGWFFIMISEQYQDYRLPGLGSYMATAVEKKDGAAQIYAIVAMMLMIVALDQLLWRPLVVWSQKFRLDDAGHVEQMDSWVVDLIRRSRIVGYVGSFFKPRSKPAPRPQAAVEGASQPQGSGARIVSIALFVVLVAVLAWGAVKLFEILREPTLMQWLGLIEKAVYTLGRVLATTFFATLIALPLGLSIGLSPRLSRRLQPVIQVIASFPAPMLFPMALALMTYLRVDINYGSVVLMLLGTQWYIVFNVVAGAMAIPADIREAAESYKITGWQRFKTIYFPGVFPYLVTGWVTAAGGAWNTSIVAEYIDKDTHAVGLGAAITDAFTNNKFALLAAAVVVMSSVVVLFNRFVWKRLYHLAETKYSLSR